MASKTIQCVGDTYIWWKVLSSGSSQMNTEIHGSDTLLPIRTRENGDGSKDCYEAIFQFDTHDIVDNVEAYVFKKVKITLTANVSSQATFQFHRGFMKYSQQVENVINSNNQNNYFNIGTSLDSYSQAGVISNGKLEAEAEQPENVGIDPGNRYITFRINQTNDAGIDVRLYSRESQYPPTLYVEYDSKSPNAPTITQLQTTVYREKPVTIAWSHNDSNGAGYQKAEIQWSANGGTWNTVTTTGTSYTFPANTFPAGTISIRIRTYNEFGNVGPYAQASFVAQRTVPAPPTINYPSGVFVNALSQVVFNWVYNATDGIGQSKVDIIWRRAGAGEWNAVQVNTSGTSYTFPANTFQSGAIEWGIRAYNTYGNASEYSYASFTAIGQSAAATISSVKNSCLTEIKWTVEEQNIFQLDIYQADEKIYSSGEQAGYGVRSYKPNIFLADGAYVCMLRVKNNSGIWSDWATRQFTISTSKPDKPGIFVGNRHYGVEIMAAYMGDNAVVFKGVAGKNDFKALAVAGLQNVYDYEMKAGLQYEYFVRTYFQNGGYTDSEHKCTAIFYGGYLISPLDEKDRKINLTNSTEMYIPENLSVQNGNSYIHYVGRRFPVKEAGIFLGKTISLTCYVTKAEYEEIEAWHTDNRDLLLLSDTMSCTVSISGMSAKNAYFNRGYELSVTFTVLDQEGDVIFNA